MVSFAPVFAFVPEYIPYSEARSLVNTQRTCVTVYRNELLDGAVRIFEERAETRRAQEQENQYIVQALGLTRGSAAIARATQTRNTCGSSCEITVVHTNQ